MPRKSNRPRKPDVESVVVPCCACQGEVTFVVPRRGKKERPTFFHTMPYCQRFSDTNTSADVVKYLQDCNWAERQRSN